MDPRQLYVEHLGVINRIAESLCRRNGVRGADAEDFVADVRLKLLQDDYAVLRKYQGKSKPTTFLTVVISNLFRYHRNKRWGKWRPSAEAKKHGEVAVMLEAAVYRDLHKVETAIELLVRDTRLKVDRAQLRKLWDDLPRRMPHHVEDGTSPDEVPDSRFADGPTLEHEREKKLQAMKAALGRAVERLAPEDRLIIRLRFFESSTIADIARAVGIAQKPLYARMKRLLEALAKDLANQGIGPEFRQWLDSAPP